MTRRQRLDKELVRRGLARSRDQAADLIAQGRVLVAGTAARKPATAVPTDAPLRVTEDPASPDYVSRGGHKLAAALDAFGTTGLAVSGRDALDLGASTGGFTDVLLRYGARSVTAVDVGYGQLDWALRTDSRVTVLDRTHANDLTAEMLPAKPQVVTADLSFISLTKVLPRLPNLTADTADFVVLVKPQFEVGREALGKGGVVRDNQQRVAAVFTVARSVSSVLGVAGFCASSLPGPAGNVEYFLWLRRGAPPVSPDLVERVVAEGPDRQLHRRHLSAPGERVGE
jgi:23S rRNA (cytidine1920-2'-O)/16S rRNA (cytidine1409-2'-O)-methyltransferase